MPTEDPYWLSALQGPEFHGVVSACRSEGSPIGAKGHRGHLRSMAGDAPSQGAILDIPQLHRAVFSCRGEQCSVRAKGDGNDPGRMAPQRMQQHAGLHCPQLHGAVKTGRGQQGAIGTEGDGRHCRSMALRVCTGAPVPPRTAHSRTVLSALAEASSAPLGLKATEVTGPA